MHACLLSVAVTIGGVNLAGSPFEIHVNAGKPSACTSHTEGSGWQRRVLVGDPLEFTIYGRICRDSSASPARSKGTR